MKLTSVSEYPNSTQILYDLLAQRPDYANISHKEMPTWDQHVAFIASDPYEAWYIMGGDCEPVFGACYLTRQNEIGVSVFEWDQGKEYGAEAVKLLMEMHGPRRYLANVAPGNEASRKMFEKLGFKLVQYTYALE